MPQFLGDDRRFDTRGERRSVDFGHPQIAPARGDNGRFELLGSLEVVELSHGPGPEPVDDE
jgi:hypothetical protein